MTIRLVANLPDYRADPRPPNNLNNVKASRLYGVEMFQKDLYVVDAGHNLLHRVNIASGNESVFSTFPNRPNPFFPNVGGPFIEAVPDNIHRFGNRLLVPLLTGFPFVPGLAEVRSVDLRSGDHVGLIPNLTSAIDIMHVDDVSNTKSVLSRGYNSGENSSYYTLEFSTNMRQGALGRLRFYSSATANPVNVVTTLVSPTSMARDDNTGDIYITNIFPGTVTKVTFP